MTSYQMTLLTKDEAGKQAVKDLMVKLGGTVTDEKPLGEKSLAYPIKKERIALFTLLSFKMAPESILPLNKELFLSGHALRHMITTAKARLPIRAALKEPKMPVRTLEPQELVPTATEEVGATKAKKTKAELKAEKEAAKDRQKAIEAELEKILREE